MAQTVPPTTETTSHSWSSDSSSVETVSVTETLPVYEMSKKQFKQEMEQLDLFFKKTFATTDAQHLQQYLLTEKNILPPYYPLFDAYSNWLTDEILTPSSSRERGLVLRRAIKLAQFFYRSGNFHAYLMTLSVLEQPSIARLRQSWTYVPRKYYSWMSSELDVCFKGDHAYLQQAMANRSSPFFPHLLAYKKDYQSVLELYNEKARQLEKDPSVQRELTELSERMREISSLVSRLHHHLTTAVRMTQLLPSSCVAGVQKWERHFDADLENRFLNRSHLLE